MTTPVPLGFSAGDVIAVSILIKKVFTALDDRKGASAEYQELFRERKDRRFGAMLRYDDCIVYV
jgi:hypothetical protein